LASKTSDVLEQLLRRSLGIVADASWRDALRIENEPMWIGLVLRGWRLIRPGPRGNQKGRANVATGRRGRQSRTAGLPSHSRRTTSPVRCRAFRRVRRGHPADNTTATARYGMFCRTARSRATYRRTQRAGAGVRVLGHDASGSEPRHALA